MTSEPSPLSANRRVGKVVGFPTDTTKVTITIGGDITKEYDAPFHEGYWPIIGDDVIVLSNQGTHYVIGTAYGSPGHVDFSTNAPASYTSVSTTFSAVSGTDSASFVKRRNGTRIKIDLRISAFAGTAAVNVEWAMRDIGAGINYLIMSMTINLTAHTPMPGIAYITGLPAGTYTWRVMGRRVSGTGTLTMDANDYIHYTIDECP